MRKIVLLIAVFFFSITAYELHAQKNSTKPKANSQFDYRVDNMAYWMDGAEKGLVPYNPKVQVKPAIYNGSELNVKGVKTPDSPDVPVTDQTDVTQSENSIFVDPNDFNYVLNSNNSTTNPVNGLYGANYFQSADGGLNWGGSEQGAGGDQSGDPAAAINLDGRQFVGYIADGGGMGVAYSDDGVSWTAEDVYTPGGQDKNHLWVDNSLSSSHAGNLYNVWTDLGGSNYGEILFSRSTDNGESWSSAINISSGVAAGSHNQGCNVQTGPNGEVYVVWSIYDSFPSDETALGFCKSTDGGATFAPAVRIIENIKGIRDTETSKNHRVNAFPSMAVDISGGSYNGNIYISWTNVGTPGVNTGSNLSVYIINSTDDGAIWSTPVRVNQGPFENGKEAYFPWITCDAETGVVAAVFYDDRNVSSTDCETYSAYSLDAGTSWTDFVVSDVSFTPAPIPNLAGGYMGDYLGITSKGGKVYPCWTDNRTGSAMTYVSAYELGLNAQFTADEVEICNGTAVTFNDVSTGEPISWEWSFPGGSPSSYSDQNPPAITYNAVGSYTVTLTVSDGSEDDTEIKTDYIVVKNIIADFSGTPTTVVIENTVTFTDESSCDPTAWTWSFPGGIPDTYSGQTPPPIQYDVEGMYDVSLMVSSAAGSETLTMTDYISVTPPIFNMTNGTITTCMGDFYDSGGDSGDYGNGENFTMTFYPSTDDAMIRANFIEFDTESNYDYLFIYDGEDASATSLGTFDGNNSPGIVTANNAVGALTFVFTSDGSVTTPGWNASLSCYLGTEPPEADFVASTTNPVIDTEITLTDLSSNVPTSWSWTITPGTFTYVNGTNENSQNPEVAFSDYGLYSVELTATNDYGSDTELKTDYLNVIDCFYCPTDYSNQSDDWISNVTFNTIDNSSGPEDGGYGDYTGISTNVEAGSSYDISVEITVDGTWVQNVWVWIDWDQNCELADDGEAYDLGETAGTGTLTTSIAVPADALQGPTRMRISELWNNDPDPCGSASYGEAEDYTVVVGGGSTPEDCEDFDELTVGGFVADQLGGMWTTWSGTPGTSEDAIVSDMYAVSPENSFLVEGSTDLVWLFGDENLTSGSYTFTNDIYIPDGKAGYWNLQKDVGIGVEWGFQVQYEDDDMMMHVDAGAEDAAVVPYQYDTWYHNEIVVDLDNDWCDFYVDGVLIIGYQWSLGTFGTPGAITLGSTNIYASAGAGGALPGAHFDDLCFVVNTPTGVQDVLEQEISVFPNPATDVVNVKSELGINNVKVYNNTGQLISNEEVNSSLYQLNTSGFETGLYFFQIESDKGVISKRIIIQ